MKLVSWRGKLWCGLSFCTVGCYGDTSACQAFEFVILDPAHKLDRLLGNTYPQIFIERSHQTFVLPEGRVFCPDLVDKTIKFWWAGSCRGSSVEPASGVPDGSLKVLPGCLVKGRQPCQRGGKLCPQPFCLEELPFVICRAVRQAEAGHEMVTVKINYGFEDGDAVRTGFSWWVVVGFTLLQFPPEFNHIHPQFCA